MKTKLRPHNTQASCGRNDPTRKRGLNCIPDNEHLFNELKKNDDQLWRKRPVLLSCRKGRKDKRNSENAEISKFFKETQQKKIRKQAETAVYPVFSGVFASVQAKQWPSPCYTGLTECLIKGFGWLNADKTRYRANECAVLSLPESQCRFCIWSICRDDDR